MDQNSTQKERSQEEVKREFDLLIKSDGGLLKSDRGLFTYYSAASQQLRADETAYMWLGAHVHAGTGRSPISKVLVTDKRILVFSFGFSIDSQRIEQAFEILGSPVARSARTSEKYADVEVPVGTRNKLSIRKLPVGIAERLVSFLRLSDEERTRTAMQLLRGSAIYAGSLSRIGREWAFPKGSPENGVSGPASVSGTPSESPLVANGVVMERKCPRCGRVIKKHWCPDCRTYRGLYVRPQDDYSDREPSAVETDTSEPKNKTWEKNPVAFATAVVEVIAWILLQSGSFIGLILAVVAIVLGAVGLAKSEGRGWRSLQSWAASSFLPRTALY